MKNITRETFVVALALRFGANVEASPDATAIAERTLSEILGLYGEQTDFASADKDMERAFSVGDFGGVLADAINVYAGTVYDAYPKTWPLFCNETELPTMQSTSIQIEPSEPETLNKTDAYPSMTVASRGESVTADRTGNKLIVSFENWVADQTGVITAPVKTFAGQAARAEDKAAITALELNGLLDDGQVAFLAARNTLITGSAFSKANLKVAIKTLRALQATQTKAELLLQPGCLLVPNDLEGEAREQVQVIYGDNDPLAIATSTYLTSTTTWFLFADKVQGDTVVMTFLRGQRKPDIVQINDFASDGMGFRYRHICGAKLVGYAGIKATA